MFIDFFVVNKNFHEAKCPIMDKMDSDKRAALEQRRRQLQIRQEAQAFMQSDVEPALEILSLLQRRGVIYKIVQMLHVKEDWKETVADALSQPPYTTYGFEAGHLKDQGIRALLESLFELYPSTNSLRYVPSLEKHVPQGLQQLVNELGLVHQKVYVYYLSYAFVLELQLHDLVKYANADTFNFWHGDALIFSNDLSWLIAYSLEEEWYGGRVQ